MTKQGFIDPPDPVGESAATTGACFCGAVELHVAGAPVEMGYCHCVSCRSHAGAPVVAYALFADHQVTITHGADLLGSFNKTGMSVRRFCTQCGGRVLTEHPGMGFTDLNPLILRGLTFLPDLHLNYADAVLPIRDGLPKLADFPIHAGGSGRKMAEGQSLAGM